MLTRCIRRGACLRRSLSVDAHRGVTESHDPALLLNVTILKVLRNAHVRHPDAVFPRFLQQDTRVQRMNEKCGFAAMSPLAGEAMSRVEW
jgi:hypothetical protein